MKKDVEDYVYQAFNTVYFNRTQFEESGWQSITSYFIYFFQVALAIKNLPANAGDARDSGSVPGSGRFPGGRHGSSLQYSCLENPMDRGILQTTVHNVARSQTWLKQLNMHACIHLCIVSHSVQWACIHFTLLNKLAKVEGRMGFRRGEFYLIQLSEHKFSERKKLKNYFYFTLLT